MPADPTQSMINPKDQKPSPSPRASAPSVPGASAEPTRAATGDVREALEEAVAREREARTEIERLTAAWKIDIAKREEAREAAGRAESALAERTRERDEARAELRRNADDLFATGEQWRHEGLSRPAEFVTVKARAIRVVLKETP